MITTPNEVTELGTILGIWAHPDDEAYLSGGLMAIARDNGTRVVCVTATRGELGTADPVTWPPDRLATTRTAELAGCLGILGVDEHHWLDFPDGGCADADTATAVERLSGIMDLVQPDTVLTFGPDGFTGHPDHRAVAGWAAAAVDRAGRAGIRLLQAAAAQRRQERWARLNEQLGVFEPGYPMLVPDDRLAVGLDLAPGIVTRKVKALVAQQTQTAGLIEALGVQTYTAWVGDECFVDRPAGWPGRSVPGQVPVDGVPGDL
ncbi:MAG TPA: PIG-L family deacetylase [Nakamurella sp.]